MKNHRIKFIREFRGLTQTEVANLIGVHRVTYVGWESGRLPLPNRRYIRLLTLLDFTEKELPVHLQDLVYDKKGYPLGVDLPFTRPKEELMDHEYDAAQDKEDIILRRLEGDQYRDREVARIAALYDLNKRTAKTPEALADVEACIAKDVAALDAFLQSERDKDLLGE